MKSKRKPCYASKGLPKVPGKPKGTDIIPAWLTPGEAVLSPGAAEMLGRGNVQALNKAASTMRLGTPQYKAEGEDQMQPVMELDSATLGNQRADEILSDPGMFDSREVQAAERYMDPAGLAGGPSPTRDAAFLGGIGGLDSVQQLAKAQQGLFGSNQPRRLGNVEDDGISEGLQAAQEAVGSALSYGRQAAQDAIEQGQRARYMAQGGIVQPGYYALGTDFVDELAQQGRALVPKGPLVSQPYGSVGPGQGFPVQPSAINTGPVSIPKPPPTFNGRVGGFSVGGYEPFKMPAPQPSALSSARGALNAGATPIGDLASSAAQGIGNAASSAGNLAGRAFGAVGNLAKNTAVGAARIGPAAMGIEGAIRGLNTPTEDYAKRIGIDTPTSTAGQLGVRALGVLSDVGASGLGMLGIDQRGRFADVAAQRTQNPQAANPILGRPAQAAEQRQPGQSAMTQPQAAAPTQQSTPAKVGTGDNAQAYYQEGMIRDGASSRLTPSLAQMDFVNSGRPASSLSKEELYKIYPSARDADARAAFDAKQQVMQPRQGLAAPTQPVNTIGNQMAGLNMSAQRQAQSYMNNALTILNNPNRYYPNQVKAAEIMLARLAPLAQTGIATSDQFYSTDANRGLTAAQANQANSTARLNYSTANLNDEKVRQERMGPAPTRVGSGSGMKIDEAITGYDPMGNPQKSSVIFNPQDGTYRPLLSQQEQMMVNQRKAQYPNEDEAAIIAFILSKRQQQLPMK